MDNRRTAPHMTALNGGKRVEKNHSIIAFRGELDELRALSRVIRSEYMEDGIVDVCAKVVIDRCNALFTCEYTGQRVSLVPYALIDAPNRMSHDPEKYFGVSHFFNEDITEPALCKLDLLRTVVRRAERAAAAAFGYAREDIVGELNTLSSYVYCCMCLYRKRMESGQ
ncbi:MAG: hypothetical protein E7328_05520 [Clostridiales bacterium]|nr:hypothetical protein [Clostridiales bacterium]